MRNGETYGMGSKRVSVRAMNAVCVMGIARRSAVGSRKRERVNGGDLCLTDDFIAGIYVHKCSPPSSTLYIRNINIITYSHTCDPFTKADRRLPALIYWHLHSSPVPPSFVQLCLPARTRDLLWGAVLQQLKQNRMYMYKHLYTWNGFDLDRIGSGRVYL